MNCTNRIKRETIFLNTPLTIPQIKRKKHNTGTTVRKVPWWEQGWAGWNNKRTSYNRVEVTNSNVSASISMTESERKAGPLPTRNQGPAVQPSADRSVQAGEAVRRQKLVLPDLLLRTVPSLRVPA
jgi:hypothetical protein